MTGVRFSTGPSLSSRTYCSSKAHLTKLMAVGGVCAPVCVCVCGCGLGLGFFCSAFLRVGEEEGFTMYWGYCQSLVDILILCGDSGL